MNRRVQITGRDWWQPRPPQRETARHRAFGRTIQPMSEPRASLIARLLGRG